MDRHAIVERDLSDPKTVRDAKLMASLGREHQRLTTVVAMANRLHQYEDELAEVRELVSADDPELAAMARAEQSRLEQALADLEPELTQALIPHDPLDDRPAIVEIRAGTGGDEAALFAADLYRMYSRFIDRHGWRTELISLSEGTLGGIKEVVFKIDGAGAFGADAD